MHKTRLLVIGGSGRLGRMLRRYEGAAIALTWQARRAVGAPGTPPVIFDPLAEPGAFAAAADRADVIVMLAGPVCGAAADLACHADLARASCAVARGKPVLVASSAAVYGGADHPLSEDAPLAPISAYGVAKATMERAVIGHPGVTLLRIGNVAGADALLGGLTSGRERRLDMTPTGHGPARSYIGPQAFSRAIFRLTRRAAAGQKLPQVLNLALPGAVRMEALLDAAGESWRAVPTGPEVIARVELDVRRAVALGLVAACRATARGIVTDLANWRRAA